MNEYTSRTNHFYLALQKLNFAFDQVLRYSDFKTEVSDFWEAFGKFIELARIVPTWGAYPTAESDESSMLDWLKLGLEEPLHRKFASEFLFEQCNSLLQFIWIATDSKDYSACEANHGFTENSVCQLFPKIGLECMTETQISVNAWVHNRPQIDTSALRAGLRAEQLLFCKSRTSPVSKNPGRPKGKVKLSKWEKEALEMLANGKPPDDVDSLLLHKRGAMRYSGYRMMNGKRLYASPSKPTDWKRGDARALQRAKKMRTK